MLYIKGKNARIAFNKLKEDKQNIDKEFSNSELEWYEEAETTRRIMTKKYNVNIENEWDNMNKWFIEYFDLFFKVFYKRIINLNIKKQTV